MNIILPEYVMTAITSLRAAGYEAYAVGGCIRDICMGIQPHDYDITTSAAPGETKRVFAAYRVVETGIAHGTVTVIIGGEPIEITTFRTDGEYEDNRHPKQVSFTANLHDDLCRRDFTVNAMAYSPQAGFVDEFSGLEHIKSRKIACVGEPDRRFREDGLRILRALRFASVLGFDIDSATESAIMRNMTLLKNISAERIYSETSKLLCGGGAVPILLRFSDVFRLILSALEQLPDEQYKRNCGFVGAARGDYDNENNGTAGSIQNGTQNAIPNATQNGIYNRAVKFALILYGTGASAARRTMGELRADGATTRSVVMLSELTAQNAECAGDITDRIALRRLVRRTTGDGCRALLAVKLASGEITAAEYDTAVRTLNEIIVRGDCVLPSQLNISGEDIISMGVERGPDVGALMERLLELVITDCVKNERFSLTEAARALIS